MAGGTFRITGAMASVTFGTSWLTDAMVDSGSPLGVDKTTHQYRAHTNFDTAIGGTPATREEIVFVAKGAGTIRDFGCILNENGSSTDIDFDLKKNGTTCLSAVVNQAHTDSDKTVKNGTLSVTSFVAGDILSISMAVTSATGAQGACSWVDVSEGA